MFEFQKNITLSNYSVISIRQRKHGTKVIFLIPIFRQIMAALKNFLLNSISHFVRNMLNKSFGENNIGGTSYIFEKKKIEAISLY